MTATLAELEARVAALEAERADYRAVLTAVNTLSVQTAERHEQVRGEITDVHGEIAAVEGRLSAKIDDTNARVRSMEEHLAEVRDLIVQGFGSGQA